MIPRIGRARIGALTLTLLLATALPSTALCATTTPTATTAVPASGAQPGTVAPGSTPTTATPTTSVPATAIPQSTATPTTSTPSTAAPHGTTTPTTVSPGGSTTVVGVSHKASPNKRLSTGALALAILGALLALGCAVWVVGRWMALEPRWTISTMHSLREASYHASATWAEFSDWAKLGR